MSTLQLTFADLQRHVGRELGFSRDPTTWGANELLDVKDVIDSGYQQFCYPEALPNEHAPHQWSWLRPVKSMTLESGVDEYIMPIDFGGLVNDEIQYISNDHYSTTIRHINSDKLRELQQCQTLVSLSYPQFCAFEASNTTADLQRWTMKVWPTPNANYAINFRCSLRPIPLSDENPVPLGGPEHSDTLRLSCLCAAASMMDDQINEARENFIQRLAASVSHDRKYLPTNLGYNGNQEPGRIGRDNDYRSRQITTYEKFPL